MRQPRHPRQGPSCLLTFVVLLFAILGITIASQPSEVRELVFPTPTLPPTRTAADHATRATLFERDGQFAEAIVAYEEAIRLDGTQINFFIPLIKLLNSSNRPDEALDWAEQAIILSPNNDQVWAVLALSHLSNGSRLLSIGDSTGADLQYAEAVRAATTAVSLNPANSNAYAYRAGALAELGPERYASAQESADLAIALEPDNPIARQYMAQVLEYQGYYLAAIEQYEYAISQNPPNKSSLLINIAYNYYATRNTPEAILTFQQALEIDPESASAYDGLGYMYFLIGEYPKAEENLLLAVQYDPNMIRAQAHLGATEFRLFNYEKAIEHLTIAVNNYGAATDTNAIYFNMLGLAYYRTNQALCPDAIPLFEAVLQVAAKDSLNQANAEEGIKLCQASLLSP